MFLSVYDTNADPMGASDTVPYDLRVGTHGRTGGADYRVESGVEVWVKRRENWLPPVEGAAQHDESRH
jgi:hypothetical protein